jgi:hypothetical protein
MPVAPAPHLLASKLPCRTPTARRHNSANSHLENGHSIQYSDRMSTSCAAAAPTRHPSGEAHAAPDALSIMEFRAGCRPSDYLGGGAARGSSHQQIGRTNPVALSPRDNTTRDNMTGDNATRDNTTGDNTTRDTPTPTCPTTSACCRQKRVRRHLATRDTARRDAARSTVAQTNILHDCQLNWQTLNALKTCRLAVAHSPHRDTATSTRTTTSPKCRQKCVTRRHATGDTTRQTTGDRYPSLPQWRARGWLALSRRPFRRAPRWPTKPVGHLGHLGRLGQLAKSRVQPPTIAAGRCSPLTAHRPPPTAHCPLPEP